MKDSRRKFLAKLGATAGAVGLGVNAQAEDEKIIMMSPDGELVEVSKEIFQQLATGKKASSDEIIKWSNQIKEP